MQAAGILEAIERIDQESLRRWMRQLAEEVAERIFRKDATVYRERGRRLLLEIAEGKEYTPSQLRADPELAPIYKRLFMLGVLAIEYAGRWRHRVILNLPRIIEILQEEKFPKVRKKSG